MIKCTNLYQDLGDGRVVYYVPTTDGGSRAIIIDKKDLPAYMKEGINPLTNNGKKA